MQNLFRPKVVTDTGKGGVGPGRTPRCRVVKMIERRVDKQQPSHVHHVNAYIYSQSVYEHIHMSGAESVQRHYGSLRITVQTNHITVKTRQIVSKYAFTFTHVYI